MAPFSSQIFISHAFVISPQRSYCVLILTFLGGINLKHILISCSYELHFMSLENYTFASATGDIYVFKSEYLLQGNQLRKQSLITLGK